MDEIKHRRALRHVMLELLGEHPNGLTPTQVYDLVKEEYTFPEEWYLNRPTSSGHAYLNAHGYSDWRDIPQSELVEMIDTEPQWHHIVRWSREQLKSENYLDLSAPRGVWRLNEEGQKAAGHLSLEGYHPEEIAIIRSRRSRRPIQRKSQDLVIVKDDEDVVFKTEPELESTTYQIPITPTAADFEQPESARVEVLTYRVLRDTKLARTLKSLHQDACQICGQVISVHGGTYSEAHHIRPLGSPHNGPDIAENILVLCPNHHVMCDYGSIQLDLKNLCVHALHRISLQFIEYHNTVITQGVTGTPGMD